MAMVRSIVGGGAVSVAALLFFSALAAVLPAALSTSLPLDRLPQNANNDSSSHPWPTVNFADLAAAGDNHSTDYHAITCPSLEFIVQANVDNAVNVDASIAAGLIRIYFNDCFPQGCDASLLLKGLHSEERYEANAFLNQKSMQLIEDIRIIVHAQCGATVSCADILALAVRRAVVRAGGVTFPVRLGRYDNVAPATRRDVSSAIPSSPRAAGGAAGVAAALLAAFASRGLADPSDLVALSGAHSIGKAHCASFADRAAEYDTDFTRKLFRDCRSDAYAVEDLDHVTPRVLDNQYYKNLYKGEGVLSSDMALLSNPLTAMWVKYYNEHPREFLDDFSAKMDKLYNVPKTGFGEIRRFSCFRTNNGRFINGGGGDDDVDQGEGGVASA
ncbi:unnamed protein product [Urochloa decumbens]|uniref:Peroxidase n=1 Tax=Urochloa decumbens TaxID=240449 RepID=A0ABC9AIA9_9POAL